MKQSIKHILYFFVLLAMYACQSDIFSDRKQSAQPAQVLLSGSLSYTLHQAATRALYESDIQRIDILSFDQDGHFVEWQQATILSSNASSCQYEALFSATDDVRVLQFVVNYPFEGSALRLAEDFMGLHQSEVMNLMVDHKDFRGSGDIYMSMWGTCELPNIHVDTDIPNLALIRVAAKLSFEIPLALRNRLRLDRVIAYNALATGMLAPASFSPNPSDWLRASEPKLKILDTIVSESANNYSAQWYSYERRVESTHGEEGFFIIIRAWYGEDALDNYSYYKIIPGAFAASAGDPDLSFQAQDIFRNRHYQFLLQSVDGRGYSSLEQAIVSPPSNHIRVETLSSGNEVHDEITNGQYKLGLTHNKLNFYEAPMSNTLTQISKVFVTQVGQGDGHPIPAIDQVLAVVELNENNLLLDASNQAYQVGDIIPLSSEGELWLMLHAYQVGLNRRGKIRIQAGNLSRLIELNQSRYSLFNLPAQVTIGSQAGNSVQIMVTPDTIQSYPLEISASLGKAALIYDNETYLEPPAAFLILDKSKGSIDNAGAAQCKFTLTALSAFTTAETASYRVQDFILSAEGFRNDTVRVRQAKP